MLLKSKGLTVDNFYIPPFTIDRGEMVTIYMFSGAHFFNLEKKLIDIFTGKISHYNIEIFSPFQFVNNTEAFSHIPNVLIDLVGQHLNKALETYEALKHHVNNGGASIFFDNINDDSLARTKHVVIGKLS